MVDYLFAHSEIASANFTLSSILMVRNICLENLILIFENSDQKFLKILVTIILISDCPRKLFENRCKELLILVYSCYLKNTVNQVNVS